MGSYHQLVRLPPALTIQPDSEGRPRAAAAASLLSARHGRTWAPVAGVQEPEESDSDSDDCQCQWRPGRLGLGMQPEGHCGTDSESSVTSRCSGLGGLGRSRLYEVAAMGANRPPGPSEGVEYRLGSSIIKTASPKTRWLQAYMCVRGGFATGFATLRLLLRNARGLTSMGTRELSI